MPTSTATPTTAGALSVEEYAKTCGETLADAEQLLSEDLTWGEAAALLGSALDDMRSVEPPPVLRDHHDTTVAAIAGLKRRVDRLDPEGTVNVLQILLPALTFIRQIEEAGDALPPDVRATLDVAGCAPPDLLG